DSAKIALIEAKTIQQVKIVADISSAMKAYAARQKLGKEIENHANSIFLDAMDRLAEMLAASDRAKGTRGQLVGRGIIGGSPKEPPINAAPTLKELGLTKKESALAQKFHALPAKTKEKIKSGVSTLSAVMAKVPEDQFEKELKMPLPSARKIVNGSRHPVWERLAKSPKDKEPLPLKGKRKSR